MKPTATRSKSGAGRSWAIGALFVAGFMLLDKSDASSQSAIRADALLLMDAGLWPLGVAAYCNKEVVENPHLLEVAAQWNKRHEGYFRRIVAVMKSTGDMTSRQKAEFDREAYRKVKDAVETQKDKTRFCQKHADALSHGQYDLDKNPATKEALARLMASNVN